MKDKDILALLRQRRQQKGLSLTILRYAPILNQNVWAQEMMKYIGLFTLIAVLSCLSACHKQAATHPPYRDEIAPPSGYSRSGEVWKDIPTNVAIVVRATIQTTISAINASAKSSL